MQPLGISVLYLSNTGRSRTNVALALTEPNELSTNLGKPSWRNVPGPTIHVILDLYRSNGDTL